MQRLHTFLLGLAMTVTGLLACMSPVSAQAVTRAYTTDSPLQRGMIVRLSAKDTTKVEALKADDITKMEGVIVAANDAPVSLSSSDASLRQVFVATTGRYEVLVSNQNGVIKKDDYITISSLDGIGMKADGNQSRIIGKAIEGFNGQTGVVGKTTVKNAAGAQVPISLGLLGVEISIGHNPIEQKQQSLVPGLDYLTKAASAVANKQIAPAQIYIALAFVLISAFVAGSVLYAGVRTAMTAIGRNPLARAAIARGLVQVVITSVIILIIGITAVYLILKL